MTRQKRKNRNHKSNLNVQTVCIELHSFWTDGFCFFLLVLLEIKWINIGSSCRVCERFLWCPNPAGPVCILLWFFEIIHVGLGWILFRLLSHLYQSRNAFIYPNLNHKRTWSKLLPDELPTRQSSVNTTCFSCAEPLWLHKMGKWFYDLHNICMPHFFVSHLHRNISPNEHTIFIQMTTLIKIVLSEFSISPCVVIKQKLDVYSVTEEEFVVISLQQHWGRQWRGEFLWTCIFY